VHIISSGYIQICHFYRTSSRGLLFPLTQCSYAPFMSLWHSVHVRRLWSRFMWCRERCDVTCDEMRLVFVDVYCTSESCTKSLATITQRSLPENISPKKQKMTSLQRFLLLAVCERGLFRYSCFFFLLHSSMWPAARVLIGWWSICQFVTGTAI